MATSDESFLQELRKQAETQQRSFIANISERLGRPLPAHAPAHPAQGAPSFWQAHKLDPEQRIASFIEHWQQAGGEAQRFGRLEEARSFIVRLATTMHAKRFIRHRHPLLESLQVEEAIADGQWTKWDYTEPDEMKTLAASADIGLIVAEYAVAVTGSIVSMSASEKGRSVSLLPTALIALVPASTIRTKLGEVMADIRALGNDHMPAGIHFISGPSRSADIENDLTIGVHGPGIVHALVIDEL